jgi:hypothetical protein
VDDGVLAYDNIELIKYKDMFDVPLHPCPWQRQHWRAAILLELAKMRRICVCKKVKRSVIPRGRKCIKCKWIFDVKRNSSRIQRNEASHAFCLRHQRLWIDIEPEQPCTDRFSWIQIVIGLGR